MNKLKQKDLDTLTSGITRKIFIYDSQVIYEDFKQIKIYDKYIPYLISSFGRVFSLNYRQTPNNLCELKTSINKKGYKCIIIRYKHEKYNLKVHRLVASAFIKNNNYVWNLEWCTAKENNLHAESHGLIHHVKGIDHPNCKASIENIIRVCELLSTTNLPIKTISKISGVSSHTVRDIKRGKTWKNISCNYNFSNYNFGHEDITKKVHEICKYIESNKYTMMEISYKTGVSYPTIKNIVNGTNYASISCNYDIKNFDKYETLKHKH